MERQGSASPAEDLSKPRVREGTSAAMLSIIIPAHNEEAALPRTIRAARSAADALGLEHEIIVVNDASTDGTGAAARGLGARVIDVNRRRIAAVRNEGGRAAKGRWVRFVAAGTGIRPDG